MNPLQAKRTITTTLAGFATRPLADAASGRFERPV